MARFKQLQICIRALGFEIIPCEETIERVQIFPFRHQQALPSVFDFAIWENRKKLLDFRQIKMAHRQCNKLVIADNIGIDRIRGIRPEGVLRFQLRKQVSPDNTHLMFVPDNHIRKINGYSIIKQIKSSSDIIKDTNKMFSPAKEFGANQNSEIII